MQIFLPYLRIFHFRLHSIVHNDALLESPLGTSLLLAISFFGSSAPQRSSAFACAIGCPGFSSARSWRVACFTLFQGIHVNRAAESEAQNLRLTCSHKKTR